MTTLVMSRLYSPTVFFTHGGGYFGGGKSAGDPLAVGNPDSYVLTEIVAHGYNLVNGMERLNTVDRLVLIHSGLNPADNFLCQFQC